MSILYSSMGRSRDARAAIKQAKLLHGSEEFSDPYYRLAVRCLKMNTRPIIEAALNACMAEEGTDNHLIPLCQGKMLLCCGEYGRAATAFESALIISRKSVSGWIMLGHAHLLQRHTSEAKEALNKESQTHVELYLLACRQQPSCSSWLGVGASCLNLHQWEEAEEALAEANVLNNREEAVWAYLAILCFGRSRYEEGEQALRQALKLGLCDGSLLTRIGESLRGLGRWREAETCLRRAVVAGKQVARRDCRLPPPAPSCAHPHNHFPTPSSPGLLQAKRCRLLADCLWEQGILEGALSTYETALGCDDLEHEIAEHCEARKSELRQRLGI
ncbi:MAG: hypothetical protein SGPRY_003450 [Prymnesium sp.]